MVPGLASQFRWLTDRAESRVRGWLGVDRTAAIEVASLSGLLAGSTARFDGDGLSIGAGAEDDVMVLDEGITEGHAILTAQQTMFGTFLSAEARGGDLYLDGMRVPAGDISAEHRLPVELSLEETTLALRVATDAAGHSRVSALWLATSCIVAAALLGLAGWSLSRNVPRPIHAVASADPVRAVLSEDAVVAALDTARADLSERGLAPFLEGRIEPGGTLVVDGVIPSRLVPKWRGFNRWYDARPDMPVLGRNVSVAGGLDGLPAVSVIRLREPRRVILVNGTEAAPGDMVVDGWTLKEIGETAMTLTRRGERITINY